MFAPSSSSRRGLISIFVAVISLLAVANIYAQANASPILPGLIAQAADGKRHVAFISATPNFTLTSAQSLHPQLQNNFTSEWTGILSLTRAGNYTLFAEAQVFLDGKEIQGQATTLTAGEHPLRVRYERKPAAPARLQLQWQTDFFAREPVPANALGHRGELPEATSMAQLERGRVLMEDLNCTACHRVESNLIPRRSAPNLSDVGARLSPHWIAKWLEHPQHFHTNAAMPTLLTLAPDRADVTAYLAQLGNVKNVAENMLTNSALVIAGRDLFNTIGCAACHHANNYPLNGLGSKWRSIEELAKYLRDPLATNPNGRMPSLDLKADEAEKLAAWLLQSTNADFAAPALPGHTGVPLRGKVLVQSCGCLNCHTLNDGGMPLASQLRAPAWKELKPNRGCLSTSPLDGTPHFALTAEDRASLVAILQSLDVSTAPTQEFRRLVKQLNCAACHELNGPAQLSLEANQAPPPLSDAGNKLRASWLSDVLLNHKRVRPWLALRMPHFGAASEPLIQAFAAQAGAEFGEGEVAPRPNAAQIAEGLPLLGKGTGGLACITCHDFNGARSVGDLRGPDMTEMSARIRSDWLRRWLREPSRLQSGTAMPAFFSDMPKIQSEPIIARLVQTLAGGKNLPLPEGANEVPPDYRLLVKSEPIVLRTFIVDSSPRSIAIGLPGGQSFVFDAENCRLRYLWSGDFLDVKSLWSNRGGGQAQILGRRYFTAPDAQPLRIGHPDTVPQVQFRGYQLVKGWPELHYEVDGVLVKETPSVAANGRGLTRTFNLDSTKDIWFVPGALTGVKITVAGAEIRNGKFQISGGNNRHFTVTIELN